MRALPTHCTPDARAPPLAQPHPAQTPGQTQGCWTAPQRPSCWRPQSQTRASCSPRQTRLRDSRWVGGWVGRRGKGNGWAATMRQSARGRAKDCQQPGSTSSSAGRHALHAHQRQERCWLQRPGQIAQMARARPHRIPQRLEQGAGTGEERGCRPSPAWVAKGQLVGGHAQPATLVPPLYHPPGAEAAPNVGALAPKAGLLAAPNAGLLPGAPKGLLAAPAPKPVAPKAPPAGEALPVLPLHPSCEG